MSYKKTLISMVVGILCAGGTAQAQNPRLAVDPDALFFRQVGANTTPPAPRNITVHTTGGGTLGVFTAVAATTSGSWLSVSTGSGTGNTTLTATVNTTGLTPATYSGTITVTAASFANSPIVVKVTLEILSTPVAGGVGPPLSLIVAPDQLKFKVDDHGPPPKPRQVVIQSPGGDGFSWTATKTVLTPLSGTWLTISATSGTGKGILDVSVNPTGLAKDKYKGQITVASGSNTAKVEVELEIDTDGPGGPGQGGPGQGGQGGQGGQEGRGRAKLLVTPKALNFIVEPNSTQTPGSRTLEVRATGHGNVLNWTATRTVTSPASGTWLSITPATGTTPGQLKVSVTTTGLKDGMYSGKVNVKAGSEEEEVKVFLRILGNSKALVQVRPKALKFTATTGTGATVSPASSTVSIASKSTGLTFNATASTARGGAWLTIAPASGAVPGTITATVVPSIATTLAPGVYTGKIEIKVSGAAQEVLNVLVTLKVFGPGDTARLVVEPGAVSFVATQGGADPAAKSVRLRPEGTNSLAWSATPSVASPTGGQWLKISTTTSPTPTTATLTGTATAATPSTINVSANITGLTQGNYNGTVTFIPASTSGAPPVQLRVQLIISPSGRPTTLPGAALSLPLGEVAPGNLVALFTDPADGFISQVDAPPSISVTVLDSAGAPVEGATVLVSSSNGEPDLRLDDVGGGQYEGVFRALFSGPLTLSGSAELSGQTASSFAVSGDLESASGLPTVIFQNGAVSAASFATGPVPIAPGSLVSLFGLNVATDAATASAIPLPATLSGVSVTIGGVPARLITLAPDSGQINLQVPFELDGQAQAEIVVNNNGVLSQPESIPIGAAPALFTLSQDGTGPGAFLHSSNAALITSDNPAAAGEVILLYATGLGAVQPFVESGDAPKGLSTVAGTVSATIGGQAADILFAGLAPNFVGLYQINVRVPAGVSAGDAPVVVSVDGTPATGRATIAVR